MQVSEIPFGQWLPDQAGFKNPGLIEADNCYPTSGGYTPFEKPVASTSVSTEPILGSAMFQDGTGQPIIVGGSETALLVKRGGTVSETTGLAALISGDAWRFERFNQNVIAVCPANPPKLLADIDTDNAWVDLPGSPPRAACAGRVNDFLVLGDLTDISALGSPVVPNRVRWSAFNNPSGDWVTDRGGLSGYQDLDPRYGRVTAIVGGRFGLVFQERAVWRMTFIGAPKAFEFEEVAVDRGCIAGQSAVTIGFETFFLSQDGFYKTDGSSVVPFGAQRVNKWLGETASDTEIRRVHGAINWPKRSIVWAFIPTTTNSFSRQVIFNFVTDEWSSASQTLHYLTQNKVEALTLSDLATMFPGGVGTMSAFALGTSEWRAKSLSFAAWVESGSGSVFAPFDGQPAATEFVTGDFQTEPGFRATVDGIWPVVETLGQGITSTIRTRDVQGGALSVTSATERAADGFCPHHVDGWLHSVRISLPDSLVWDHAQGFQVRSKRSGRR